MIYIGAPASEKARLIARYISANEIDRVVVVTGQGDAPVVEWERIQHVTWPQVIEYTTFYPLLQTTDRRTLFVLNECLRTQNRHDLSYNCIRHYLNQAGHVMIFQYMPMIDTVEDFMVLFDWDTKSKWKREKFITAPLQEVEVILYPHPIRFNPVEVRASIPFHRRYEQTREKLFSGIGQKDPHTLPRTLHLMTGEVKRSAVDPTQYYACRNQRFKESLFVPYEQVTPGRKYGIFEWCHRFIDFTDFLSVTGQENFDVLTTDLPVDQWYLQRYTEWSGRVADAYTALQQ